jgi:LacI family transcriptional regulator
MKRINGKRVTLALVAQTAGVSPPTVSKVLNNRGDVAPETRTRVEQVLRELDYVPRGTRRAQADNRCVELVFSDYKNPYFGEILHGAATAADEAGIDVVLGRFPAGSARAWVRRLVARGREGVIILTSEVTGEHVAAFQAAGLSLVVIDPVNPPKIEVSSIGATNWAGGVSATEHLIELGHRRIAFIGGLESTACSQARLHGFRGAMENAGLSVVPALVSHGNFSYECGFREASRLLALGEPPTAIFASADPIAFGVVEAARRQGVRVPDDLSVVGFDDTYAAAWASPPLTTVHQPLQEMGRAALRTLQGMAAGTLPDMHHIELATHLVVRATSAPPT